MTTAYALAKIIWNREGQPADYIFVDVNSSFLEITGLSCDTIGGKKASELEIPWQGNDKELMKTIENAALRGKSGEVRVFNCEGKCWYRLSVYSPAQDYFVAFIRDITEEIQQYEEINVRLKEVDYDQAALKDFNLLIGSTVDTDNIGFKKSLDAIQHKETRLQSILNILEYKTNSLQEFLDHALDEIIKLTHSKIGYIYFYCEENKEFILNTWSKDVLSECRTAEQQTRYQLEKTGLWGEAVRQRRSIIENDFHKANPYRKGYPEGHVELYNFLTVPVFYEERIVAVIGVANKETDYDQNDILNISLVMNSIWKSVEIRHMHELICDSEERYRLLFMNMTEGNALHRIVFSEEGNPVEYEILKVNPAYEYIFGIKKDQVEGKTGCEAYKVAEPPFLDVYARVALTAKSETFETYIPAITKYLQISVHSLHRGVFATIIEDITERKRFENLIHAEKEQLHITLESIGDGVISTDKYGKMILINEVAENLTGWRRQDAVGRRLKEVLCIYDEETGLLAEDLIDKVLQTGSIVQVTNESVLKDRYDVKRIIEYSAAPIKDKASEILGVVIVFRDITEKKQHLAEIKFLSMYDKLTGLYNRTFFEEIITKVDHTDGLPLSVIFGDVNGLKLTNDVFGHQAGDDLLKNVAQIMKKSCRAGDIVARLGGDEFVILLPNTSSTDAYKTIKQIQNNISAAKKEPVKVSVALGSATKEKETEDFELVLKKAEDRMYRRKMLESKNLRSGYIFSLKETLFRKSYETHEHAERLKSHSKKIAVELGLLQNEIDDLELLALLHDVGKITISDNLLLKPGQLSHEEWGELKRHSEVGYRIARNIAELSSIAEYILFHHERWDGKGYPQGLKGKEIPLLARIISVVDAYDAITHDRSYRKAMTHEEAVEEICKNAGTQFDPEIVRTFCCTVK